MERGGVGRGVTDVFYDAIWRAVPWRIPYPGWGASKVYSLNGNLFALRVAATIAQDTDHGIFPLDGLGRSFRADIFRICTAWLVCVVGWEAHDLHVICVVAPVSWVGYVLYRSCAQHLTTGYA